MLRQVALAAIVIGAPGCIEWDSLSDNFNPNATLLFRSGFEPSTEYAAPSTQELATSVSPGFTGEDGTTGFSWGDVPIRNGGRGFEVLHVLSTTTSPAPGFVVDYIANAIEDVIGHDGDHTHAFRMNILKPSPSAGIQNDLGIPGIDVAATPLPSIYIRYRLKFPPELLDEVRGDPGYFRVVWKLFGSTASVTAQIGRSNESPPRPVWHLDVGGAMVESRPVVIPADRWLSVEIHLRRAVDGLLELAMDDELVVHYPENTEIGDITTIKVAAMFGSSPTGWVQWIDDLELWDEPPCKTLPCGPPSP